MNSRVTTRERGVIPGCRPVGKNDHMVIVKPGNTDIWLAELRANTRASRKNRGACETCGEQPKPERPLKGKLYCQCPAVGDSKAAAA